MQQFISQQKKASKRGFTLTLIFLRSFIPEFRPHSLRDMYAEFDILMRRKQSLQQASGCRGFTLVEMLVSISLFAAVMTMSVSMLLVLIDANGRAQSMQLVMTNLSFALDSMTREVRTGVNWYCDTSTSGGTDQPVIPGTEDVNDCSAGGNYVSTIESGDSLTEGLSTNRITYWFNPEAYGPGRGGIFRKLGTTAGDGDWVPLTSEEVDIDEAQFIVLNTEKLLASSDKKQPTMLIYLKGRAGFESNDDGVAVREFNLQTAITQRMLDI